MKISITYSLHLIISVKIVYINRVYITFILFLEVGFLTPQIFWYFPLLHVNFASKQKLSLTVSL